MKRLARPKKPKPAGIMVVMENGPHRCLTPIPRSDLHTGCPTFRLPSMYTTVTYRLQRVEAGVHYYQQEVS